MNQEDKELLLKDLCCRLPYYTLVYLSNTMEGFDSELSTAEIEFLINNEYMVKPYLFPLSSMTEEQKEELKDLTRKEMEIITDQLKTGNCGIDNGKYHFNNILELNWLNENNFDYRGLISKGLAIDCTGLNIYV